MDDLLSEINESHWKKIVDIQKFQSELVNGKIKIYIQELSGTTYDVEARVEGERKDRTVFLPLIYISICKRLDLRNALKAEGVEYKSKRVPSCYKLSSKLKMKISTEDIILFDQEQEKQLLTISISEYTYNIIKNLKNLTLFIVDSGKVYVSSVPIIENKEKLSLFPMRDNMSIFGNGLDLIKLVQIINNFEQVVAFKPDYMQDDLPGTSDYYCYESTSEKESLPSSRKLTFKKCFACGKDEKSKEHCSPKWITDKYKVKALIADIFCKECNNWFGVNLENKMQQFLTTGCINNTELIHWCIKTSLTMSIASGVPLNTSDLIQLRKDITPLDYEVYFDTFGCQDSGFYYGVSHFETQIRERGTFLFTFTMPDFSFVVIKNKEGISLDVPIKKIWPQVPSQSTSTPHVLNFTDLHQNLHETLSRQKTENVDLKFRMQKG